MELFQNAKSVRLRSRHDKYLLAEYDQESVCQDRNGSCNNAKWTIEFVDSTNVLRLKSCYGKYLTASNVPFLLGMTGKKVLQTMPRKLDSSVEWEPIREGFQVRLKTRYGHFLRANGGLPPWRNSITHDIPHRTATQDWVLWEVEVVEIRTQSDDSSHKLDFQSVDRSDSLVSEPSSPSSIKLKSPRFGKFESSDSFVGSPVKAEGRIIYYNVADDNGELNSFTDEQSFTFKGNGVDELTQKLEEETRLEDIVVCSRNPLNGKLYPLRLHLPPNNTTMHLVVVPASGTG